jgi:cell division protein FtsA
VSFLPGHGRPSRLKPLSAKKATIVTVLDIGSTKIVCLIAHLKPVEGVGILPNRTHTSELLGFGHQRSRGVKSGVIVDMDAAEQAIRLAIDSAERMSGLTVESLIVNVSCGRLASDAYAAEVRIGGHEVEDSDIQRVLDAGAAHAVRDGRSVVHALPIGFALDAARGIRDPRGMLGETLGVDMHVVSVESAPLRNVLLCVERCHLHVDAVVATPYAAALAALVDDECELGAAVVDMGGGTTSLAVFAEGRFVHADVVRVGGDHVTSDIARGLATPMNHAERLKTLHGSPLPCPSDEREFLTIAGANDDEMPTQAPRSALVRIIRPRVEETLELVRDRLAASGHAAAAGRCIVLTGGASQLTGVTEVARRILGKQIRIGRPLGIGGMPEGAKGPAFSAVAGLAVYPQVAQIEQFQPRRSRLAQASGAGPIASIRDWLRQSF